MYGRHEWVVVKKRKDKYKLVRRQLLKGPPIWVDKKKIKLACQKWRSELKKNDTVSLFIAGMWTAARITRRVNSYVFVQPSFTNYAERIYQGSNRIAYMDHNYPLWEEDNVRLVMHDGNIRTERAPGLLFPWEYVRSSNTVLKRTKFIKQVKFKYDSVVSGHYPFSYYSNLSTMEIVYDMFHNAVGQDILLHNILLQYLTSLEPMYHLCSEGHLPVFVEIALANQDQRRVNELLSVGENIDLFHRNEWAVWKHMALPFFDLRFKFFDTYMTVDLSVNPRSKWDTIDMPVSKIMESISQKDDYSPDVLEIDGPTEQSYIVSRMIGMELEPFESIYLRFVHSSCWLTLHGGFCEPSFNRFGGVLSAYGCNFRKIVELMMSKNPLKTLIVVPSDVISDWKDLPVWHGRRREMNNKVLITTKNTFVKTWHRLVGFQRIICFSLPSSYDTVYAKALASISCATRWAILNEVDYKKDIEKAFIVHGFPYDERAVIRLNKSKMESMGIEFPMFSQQKIHFEPYDYTNVVANLRDKPRSLVCSYLSKFLIHSSLVPAHLRGKKIDLHEATTVTICDKFSLDAKQLESHLQDKCAVCLEELEEAMVTPCGHVFCPDCVKELQSRKCKCPMCRGRIDGYIKVSDKNTAGNIVMYKGDSYILNEEERWGEKVVFLRKCKPSTIVTRYVSVKRKLARELPQHDFVTTEAVRHGLVMNKDNIVFLEPMETGFEKYIDRAWGKNKKLTSLSYRLSNQMITLS